MRDAWSGFAGNVVTLEVEKPTPAEQRMAWDAWLGEVSPGAPALMAGQFNLNMPAMRHIATLAVAAGQGDATAVLHAAWQGCVSVTRPRLESLAQAIPVVATWAQLVLPATEKEQLRQLIDQVRQRNLVYQDWGFAARMNRGFGITSLFLGESGTGKTMAAEVIASELNLSLFRIDLSAVVSKYIGETEKNLRRLFDAAEDGGAILLFDEADALFGKRSEVKDSHDRYANIEINYLLQRMEAFRGLAILATNAKSALDNSFQRRLRFTVNFPFPGAAERKQIWQIVFPPEAPTRDLDFERLARLPLTGGNIHNIALNAAFLAAQTKEQAVTMDLVLEAANRELQRLNRPVNAADLRPPAPRIASA